MSDYLTRLAQRLGERGVDADRSRALLEDLAAHTAESGADPEEGFGPVEEFADALAPPPAPGRRRYFLGWRGALALGACLLVAVVAGTWSVLRTADGAAGAEGAADWAGFAAGAVLGALLAIGLLRGAVRLVSARRDRG